MSITSDNLKKTRKAIDGLTRDKAAELLDIPRSTYGHIEEGKTRPSLTNLVKILKFYNITDCVGFITNEHFDQKKQAGNGKQPLSIVQERYIRLPKKLRKVVDEMLNLA